ncbi:MAG: DUF362 domain-containing protein [Thermodesulfobacteriota bacterium]
MASQVFFANLRCRSAADNKAAKIARLFAAAGFGACLAPGRLTAVKVHFGEMGNDTFLSPVLAAAVVAEIKKAGARPFLTDTNTLYAGSRHNAADHLATALRHGFGYEVTGAPVLIADGLLGENETEVAIPGRRIARARMAGAIVRAEAMLVLSHFKGHELAGFGGAVKNLAMGCATGAGKRDQHSPRFDVDPDRCAGCGECAAVCPAAAIAVAEGRASIDKERCVGCGECYIHCPEKALEIDWRTEIPVFMERMTEYALAAVQGKQGRLGFFNFLLDVTPDCDCLPWSDAPLVPDIGILASKDPVALDAACLDLVNRAAAHAGTHLTRNLEPGADKFSGLWGHTQGRIQLDYGQELGLGGTDYRLVEL